MALELIPLGNIVKNGELTTVACKIHEHVARSDTKQLLQSRHLLGVLRRHGGEVEGSEQAVSAARRLHTAGQLGVYVLKNENKYVGMATIDPAPRLRKQIVSIPPKFARGPLSKNINLPGPEVSAWVAPGHGPSGRDNLTAVYRQLSDSDGIARSMYEQFSEQHLDQEVVQSWTIEPHDAPQWIHTAIRRAGYTSEAQNAGFYDDAESRRQSPPMSRLYLAPAQ